LFRDLYRWVDFFDEIKYPGRVYGLQFYPVESELCFRIVKGITIAYSLRLNFYDEVYEALSLPEQFEQYIAERCEYLHLLYEFKGEIDILKLSDYMFQRFGK
jgi:hypothetical protein